MDTETINLWIEQLIEIASQLPLWFYGVLVGMIVLYGIQRMARGIADGRKKREERRR